MKQHINRKNFYSFLLFLSITLAIMRFNIYSKHSLWFDIYMFGTNLLGFICTWEILLIAHSFFNKIFPKTENFIVRMVVQIFLVTVLFTQESRLIHLFGRKIFEYDLFPWNIMYQMNFLMAVIFNLTLFGSQYFYRWKRDLINKANLEKERAEVKYDALRNQLNPHFLFNALTSLNSLIFENQQLASDFLQQLAKLYRYILQNRDNTTVSLRSELNFVQHYVFLLKTRFGDAISIEINAEEQDMDKGIVPVLSQILLENAIKHNIISTENPLAVSLTTQNDFLVVENNIIKKSNVENSNKMGMENLRALYNYLTDRTVEIEEKNDRYIVRIPLIH